jgi:hypothetical protein
MSGTRGHPVQMAVTMLSRLVLAALIAIVVALPLVLQIFASDVGAQLPIIQQQQSKKFAQGLATGADGKQLAAINAEITTEENLINGKGGSQVATDQATVNQLTGAVQRARNAENTAYAKWQCEIGGLKGSVCPPGTSGRPGNGPLAQSDQEAYNNAVNSYNTVNGQLIAAENTLKNDQKAAGQAAGNAQQALANLKKQRTALQNKINALIASDDKANKKDTGLLEQIQALNAASAQDSGLAVAHWTVTALFFVIEILPVSVKCLLLLGDQTAYEQILAKKSEAAVQQADLTVQAETDAVRTRAQSVREIAEREEQTRRNIREAQLQSDYAIARDREQARQDIEADIIRRNRGTRIEVNKRYASATREHILAAVDDWARRIREKINQAAQRQGANGQVQQRTQVQQASGYNTPNGSGI